MLMKSYLRKSVMVLAGIGITPIALLAQTPPPPPTDPSAIGGAMVISEDDKAWGELSLERRAMETSRMQSKDGEQSRADLLARSKSLADRARQFYAKHPNHPMAGEARKLEVFSLIEAREKGDKGEGKRLERQVETLRKDPAVPASIRAQAAAAYDFTSAILPLRGAAERMTATVDVARKLAKEFPAEPQAYEALLAVAKASPKEDAEKLAREIVESPAPEAAKKSAQLLLDRHALVGRTLASVIGEAGDSVLAELPAGLPVVVYSWATWGPGSIEFGRMIQARRFAAIGVCLDENTEEAATVAHQVGMGGKLAYDSKGLSGELAERLKFSTAGQIYLVDADGVIRDVRGGEDLETKLAAFDFRTPVINPTAKELRP